MLIYELKDYVRNTSFENMHQLIINANIKEIATYDDGIKLSRIFDDLRSNSAQKEWS